MGKMNKDMLLAQPISTIIGGWTLQNGNLIITIKGSDGVEYGDIIIQTQKNQKAKR
jgi:hypothetical protein